MCLLIEKEPEDDHAVAQGAVVSLDDVAVVALLWATIFREMILEGF